jgi:hypothetical protein
MNFRRMTSIMIAVLMITFPATLTAGESSLLLGTWSFIGDLDDHSPGSYGVLGLTSGVSDRLEVSTFMLLQMTPELLSGVHLGSGLGFSLLSPRSAAAPDTPSYVSAYVDTGVLIDMHEASRAGFSMDEMQVSLYVRLTPLALGTMDYGGREKLGSFGLLYTPGEKSFGFFWNPILYDHYL